MAKVTISRDRYTVDPLYQWDLNQELQIYGLSLPSIPEIHFTNDAMDKAIVRQATMDSAGVITAEIPNSLLQKPYKIRAYVCIYEGDTFKSMYLITIPIQARSMPLDYTLTVSDDEVYSFNALENKIDNTLELVLKRYEDVNAKYEDVDKKYNEALDILEETVVETTALKESAKTSAESARTANASAQASAQSAEQKAKESEESAKNSAMYANNASASAESALSAKNGAESAKTDAINAKTGAESAKSSAEKAQAKAETAYSNVENIISKIDIYNIPDYVIAESEHIIDRVIEAQGNRTFTFVAISDMHYGNDSYTDGIKHACQAIKYIDERVKLDAVAVLGDYTDGYPSSAYANAISDFKDINKILDTLRFGQNLRMQGNHDYYEGHKGEVNRFIASYSECVTWGDITGGYFYKDFDGYKIRVICLNTTETDNSNIAVSKKQYEWFINSLDLSPKENATDWQILILSHHPLDWWVVDSKYRFGQIIHAYKSGSAFSDTDISCNFAGKNSAVLIGNIHGHIHNLLTDTIYFTNKNNAEKTSVYRICTPNACYGRENQYDGWNEETSYPKTRASAKDTAFVIYCINLDTHIIKAICYGAGYDRELDYINGISTVSYSVQYNLTNVTSSNTTANIQSGKPYSTTLSAEGDIKTVTVTMNGIDITSSVYTNGTITIDSVIGNIVITVVAEEVEKIVNLLDTVGYTDGMRFSGSNGVEKSDDVCMATGYIEVGNFKNGDHIYGWGTKVVSNK